MIGGSSLYHQLTAEKAENYVRQSISEAFCKPVTVDDDPKAYLPTQILAELFKSSGVDGIAHWSSLMPDSHTISDDDQELHHLNVILFDLESVKLLRGDVVKVTDFIVQIAEGPFY